MAEDVHMFLPFIATASGTSKITTVALIAILSRPKQSSGNKNETRAGVGNSGSGCCLGHLHPASECSGLSPGSASGAGFLRC